MHNKLLLKFVKKFRGLFVKKKFLKTSLKNIFFKRIFVLDFSFQFLTKKIIFFLTTIFLINFLFRFQELSFPRILFFAIFCSDDFVSSRVGFEPAISDFPCRQLFPLHQGPRPIFPWKWSEWLRHRSCSNAFNSGHIPSTRKLFS